MSVGQEFFGAGFGEGIRVGVFLRVDGLDSYFVGESDKLGDGPGLHLFHHSRWSVQNVPPVVGSKCTTPREL